MRLFRWQKSIFAWGTTEEFRGGKVLEDFPAFSAFLSLIFSGLPPVNTWAGTIKPLNHTLPGVCVRPVGLCFFPCDRPHLSKRLINYQEWARRAASICQI